MVAIVAHDAIRKPVHPEGKEWLVVWLSSAGQAIFADSLSDIAGELIPGYSDLDDLGDDDPHLEARIEMLATLASRAQATVLSDMALRDVELSQQELNAALADKELAPDLERWNPAEPLILLTTCFEPFTDKPRPEGAVVWLDPSNEAGFLSALARLGEGELWVTGA